MYFHIYLLIQKEKPHLRKLNLWIILIISAISKKKLENSAYGTFHMKNI